ncbi:MAG: transcriptional coactivator p15/PC4 family protein [Candidatus Aminicenantes bacterium]|nr:transcriptional coactivator p15/PC4 family protein [Candidatus Aminicenantes bacterium]
MIVGEIERSDTERLRVECSNYKGKDFLSVRIYYLADNGEWRPTKKGITVKPEKMDEFIDLLSQAKEKFPTEE